MVAFQPDLEQVGELAIGRDVLRREVIVVIEDRLVGGVTVEKPLCSTGLEQEIVVDEGHGEENDE